MLSCRRNRQTFLLSSPTSILPSCLFQQKGEGDGCEKMYFLRPKESWEEAMEAQSLKDTGR